MKTEQTGTHFSKSTLHQILFDVNKIRVGANAQPSARAPLKTTTLEDDGGCVYVFSISRSEVSAALIRKTEMRMTCTCSCCAIDLSERNPL